MKRLRPKSNGRMVTITDPLLTKLEKLWEKSEDPLDFGYWFRNWVKEKLK